MVILVDFDNTIADSSRCIYELYQIEEQDFSVKYTYEHGWNFEGLIPQTHTDWAVSLFNSDVFYKNLKPIEKSIEVLKILAVKHKIVIVTKGETNSLSLKSKWIKQYLPFIHNVVYLEQNDYNKGLITGDIIIDDKLDCIFSSNCNYKILFGNYGWNNTDISGDGKDYIRLSEWDKVLFCINYLEYVRGVE